ARDSLEERARLAFRHGAKPLQGRVVEPAEEWEGVLVAIEHADAVDVRLGGPEQLLAGIDEGVLIAVVAPEGVRDAREWKEQTERGEDDGEGDGHTARPAAGQQR